MQFIKSFFKRITDDLKQKKLIPLKILFFVHASTLFVLYPYLTIHMRELGINVEETAIMSAVTPVVSIVMPPLAGMLADKIGNFRCLLALSSVLGGASALLLLAVPVGRITVTFPPAAELLASCEGGSLRLRHVHDHPCAPLHPYSYDVNLTILSCGFVCDLPKGLKAEDGNAIARSHSYDVHLQSADGQRLVYRHTVSGAIVHPMAPKKDQSTSRIMANDPFFNSSITKLPNGQIFFPAPQLYRIQCSRQNNSETCAFGRSDFMAHLEDGSEGAKYKVRISHDAQKPAADVKNYLVKAVAARNVTDTSDDDYDGIDSVTCEDNFGAASAGVRVSSVGRRLSQCAAACAATAPRAALCENAQQQIDIDPSFTFWTYLAVRVFIGIIGGTAFAMFEGAVIAIVREQRADYGLQRVYGSIGGMISSPLSGLLIDYASRGKGYTDFRWVVVLFAMFEGAVIAIVREQRADYGLQRVYGSIGGMISSPLSGLLIDYASRGKGYTDFRPAFYLYAVLKMASGALMLSIDLEFKQPAQNLLDDVISVFRNVEIVALFIACFIMGTAWGYIESFLFWLLQDLGASRSLMGITITVGGVAGLPLLVLSGPIIRRLGHANVLFIGFVFYAIRLLGYSLIYNPWLCLVFEALESVTSSLSFTAAVTYAARLSSTTTDTSVQGLLGGLYYGVGKGSGSLIGGYLMKFFGTRPTYQIFSAATLLTGCIYYLFNAFYLRKRAAGDDNDLCKKRPDDVECRDAPKEADKNLNTLDVAPKVDATKEGDKTKEVAPQKLGGDNIDGGSDSGVDNPAFSETEISTASDPKKDDKPSEG